MGERERERGGRERRKGNRRGMKTFFSCRGQAEQQPVFLLQMADSQLQEGVPI